MTFGGGGGGGGAEEREEEEDTVDDDSVDEDEVDEHFVFLDDWLLLSSTGAPNLEFLKAYLLPRATGFETSKIIGADWLRPLEATAISPCSDSLRCGSTG